jgi:type II secretory pathway component PulF
MNHDEFAFFNQQLASMLRDGVPLEGAIKQLCAGMKTGTLRAELELLERELADGTPLPAALARRKLPVFYLRMLELGARSNDLPGVLTLLADHYQRANALWTRLKGLLVYPLLVIGVSLGLTLLLSVTFSRLLADFFQTPGYFGPGAQPSSLIAAIWIPPLLLALLALLMVVAISIPALRSKLRWRLPGFREASLAQIASALALMLKQGTTLADSLALAEALESNSPAGKTLAQWHRLVVDGKGKPSQWPAASKPFPPMFLWLVQRSGEDIASGFQKAAEIYQTRASYRIEIVLYGLLPVSILLLGQMVFWQVAPMVRSLTSLMNALGGN